MGYEDHVQDELDRLGRGVAETAARVGRIGPVVGQASDSDDMITVSVSPGGLVRSVNVKPAVLGRRPDEVAAEIVRLAARATRIANARMHSSVRSAVGPDVVRNIEQLGMPAGAVHEDDDDFGGVLR
ncbi:hypothetical protein ACFQ1S_13120 [Kibdelosporangium lantanae]|uniref:YbaB/EbfC DNA-binding family protein n=1 Tax=Kibdelosporangium lantanae TaxID=1497396 RepID=A0ABW3M946_9PSEU